MSRTETVNGQGLTSARGASVFACQDGSLGTVFGPVGDCGYKRRGVVTDSRTGAQTLLLGDFLVGSIICSGAAPTYTVDTAANLDAALVATGIQPVVGLELKVILYHTSAAGNMTAGAVGAGITTLDAAAAATTGIGVIELTLLRTGTGAYLSYSTLHSA